MTTTPERAERMTARPRPTLSSVSSTRPDSSSDRTVDSRDCPEATTTPARVTKLAPPLMMLTVMPGVTSGDPPQEATTDLAQAVMLGTMTELLMQARLGPVVAD